MFNYAKLDINYIRDDLLNALNGLNENTIDAFLDYWVRPVPLSHPISKYLVHCREYGTNEYARSMYFIYFDSKADLALFHIVINKFFDMIKDGHTKLIEAMTAFGAHATSYFPIMFKMCKTPQDYKNLMKWLDSADCDYYSMVSTFKYIEEQIDKK